MAEIVQIATSQDLIDRLSSQAYTRLFAKNGGTTVDTAFRDLCLTEANSLFQTMTRNAFPDGVYLTGDTIDQSVIGCVVDLATEIAARRHTAWDAEGAYAEGGRRTREFIKAINRNADAEPAGSSTTPGHPRSSILNVLTSRGAPTNPYTLAADYKGQGGF